MDKCESASNCFQVVRAFSVIVISSGTFAWSSTARAAPAGPYMESCNKPGIEINTRMDHRSGAQLMSAMMCGTELINQEAANIFITTFILANINLFNKRAHQEYLRFRTFDCEYFWLFQ